ncbi:MAG: hypothetical protein JXB48_00240 [Candidatus Latescibacteria bacterium]|nr:hypothetical protein [Candidatus Latescibacterota bacterium]
MRLNFIACTGILAVILFFTLSTAFAQNESPVRIEFDKNSKRTDLLTGKELPDYKYVQRGSIQFFMNRLDEPDDYVYFTHDGIRKAEISSLNTMEKIQPRFAIWRLIYKSGSKNTPRIQHLAVSFIPLSTTDKKPGKRVYVLLNDLALIEWGE